MRVRTRGLALQLVILCSLLLTLLSGALGPRPGTPPPAAQAATGAGGTTPFVYESFANSTPDNTGWVLGGTAQLTSGTTDGTTGTTDPSGAGWLRFTSETDTNTLGYAYYNVPLTVTNGLIISFDYTCWGGGAYGP